MKRKLFQWFAIAIVSAGAFLGSHEIAGAQESWRSYRGPYVAPSVSYYGSPYSTYYYGGPGYYRSYSVQPYSYSYGPVYSSYYGSYYAPTYAPGAYYGLPRAGYYPGPYGAGQVRVGRMRIGW